MNIEMARAILVADEEDAKEEEEQMAKMQAEREEEEKRAQLRAEADQKKKEEAQMKTVNVDADFDPTRSPGGMRMGGAPAAPAAPQGAPQPAKKEDVVFQATSENIQELVLESPVPVLLDVYADWCGPCKALTPALEEMAVKGGGAFRLVKLNTDEERNISSALGVTSLPTIFGIKDGRIIHSFKGMPRDQEFMKNFMMGLLAGMEFKPAPTQEEKDTYAELSKKLLKIAGSSGFSFSQRENMQVRTNNKLDELVQVRGDMSDAEESAKILRSLLSNVIKDPFEIKFRKVNLENKVIAARVGAFDPALSILKAVGFKVDEDSPTKVLVLGKGKKIVNIAPLVVARDAIDKWIDMNRRAIATALRKKQDTEAYKKLLEEAQEVESDDEEEKEEVAQIDHNMCALKLRMEGKNKVHDLSLGADDTLSAIIESLPVKIPEGEEVTITCAARRLTVKSTDEDAMAKTLRESKLSPAASIVVKIGSGAARSESSSSLKDRAAARKDKSKGEHTMQSIGIYSKDDNAKGELIDGGGGTWYEQDITTDDEAEENDEGNSIGESADNASDDDGSSE
jgi:thioredoxin 1